MIKNIFFDFYDTLCVMDEEKYYEGKRKNAETAGVSFERFMDAWRSTARDATIGKLMNPFERADTALKSLSIVNRNIASQIAKDDLEVLLDCAYLYDGAMDCLNLLKDNGYNLGLISNASPSTAFLVQKYGLRACFSTITFSYEVSSAKPDKKIYVIALKKHNAVSSESVFIGDGANKELDAANDLGFFTILMDHPYKAKSFRDPSLESITYNEKITSFGEILPAVRRIAGK